jgi:hypothetical protein
MASVATVDRTRVHGDSDPGSVVPEVAHHGRPALVLNLETPPETGEAPPEPPTG